MPTKADRKHLDATVAAFHSHYASDANWGSDRWHESLYPALARATRYGALVNQYVSRAEVYKVLLTGVPEDELRLMELPPPSARDGKINVTEADVATAGAGPRDKDGDESTFLFPVPQPIVLPGDSEKSLLSHWNMDAASALCAHMLDVQPNDKVLDLCAAPGGKSVTLAQLIFPHFHANHLPLRTSSGAEGTVEAAAPTELGCLHSNEIDHARNKRLAANLRAYLPTALFESNAVRVLRLDGSDARVFTQLPLGPGSYDRVLLDAPCSSERHIIHAHLKAASAGRIADEMARWRRGGSKTLAKLQTDLLMTALRAVKVGGRVVYSTCSIETGENDGVMERMLAASDASQAGAVLDSLTEETKYGRIAVPDHPAGGQWGPLYFCVITKIARKA
ncbi:S-adenosyl-L-methionine-dependent methyltransferase [Coniella lustricola]|uniref:NOL1/NOP2/Sun domain family member 4 n=1 Tax=Coniella lustricola TaxID=2025994 RepID=A0A2T3ACN8_9PEZI|nr:S-adenosyl-L-methionine-dependent methyltransferase [Coniella lustricola]